MRTSILVTAGAIILASCNNSTQENATAQTDSHETHQHEDNATGIQLNMGQKWVVNEEMRPFVLEAENILTDYVTTNSSDYKALAEQLKEKNAGLIKSCTMKGESHDELHKWLHPHMEIIKSLSVAKTPEEASEIIANLQTSFSTYHQYFQ